MTTRRPSRTRLVTRAFLVFAGCVVLPVTAGAQGLRDQISQLFIFGSGSEPLFLAGSADPNNPASVQAHGRHFIPASAQGNGLLISFITNAVSLNVANVPVSATSSGSMFHFEGGVPVRTAVSPGSVFGERAQTLGRGRVLAGINRSTFRFSSLRGVPLSDIRLNFTHQNVTNAQNPTCDSTNAALGSCDKMGIPLLENDIIQLDLDLTINTTVTSFYMSYGLTDRIDVGLVLPIVSTTLAGQSTAQVIPFGGPTAAHFFAGTPSQPVLTAARAVSGSSTGLGDVAARVKINLSAADRNGFALLGEARFATGSEEDLLGSGSTSIRGVAVFSGRFDDFSPHVNLGYVYRGGEIHNDAVLATAGFDQILSPWATLGADVVSELQVGQSALEIPGIVQIEYPFRRTVNPSSVPRMRDDIVNGSFGFKFTLPRGFTAIMNALIPLNKGGLRSDHVLTGGLEYSF
jgi:hypothetical protein